MSCRKPRPAHHIFRRFRWPNGKDHGRVPVTTDRGHDTRALQAYPATATSSTLCATPSCRRRRGLGISGGSRGRAISPLSTVSLSVQQLADLAHGSAYSFRDWPNSAVPMFGAGVYTIWHNDGRFIYVGMSGRGMTIETPKRNTPRGRAFRVTPVAGEVVTSSASM
jgi:hypothetical protein